MTGVLCWQGGGGLVSKCLDRDALEWLQEQLAASRKAGFQVEIGLSTRLQSYWGLKGKE